MRLKVHWGKDLLGFFYGDLIFMFGFVFFFSVKFTLTAFTWHWIQAAGIYALFPWCLKIPNLWEALAQHLSGWPVCGCHQDLVFPSLWESVAQVIGCVSLMPRAAHREGEAKLWRGYAGTRVELSEASGESWHGKLKFSPGEWEAFSTASASYWNLC